MTAQFPERLHYRNRKYSMCTNPLEDYFELTGNRPNFVEISTALWRGYIGNWVIIHDRLYLIGIDGSVWDKSPYEWRALKLEELFPGFPNRVFAHWYTGTIRLPFGKLLDYVHGGYGSTYEHDLMLELTMGVVTRTFMKHHSQPEDNSHNPIDIPAFLIKSSSDKS
jgi:hypothetical protein